MGKLFKLEIATPTKKIYEDEVEFISFDALNGRMGVLAGHTPMVVANKPGTFKMKKNGEEKYAFISEGFIEITKEKVSAVVDFAGWTDKLNTEKIMRDKQMAEEKLEDEMLDKDRKLELIALIERSKAAMRSTDFRN